MKRHPIRAIIVAAGLAIPLGAVVPLAAAAPAIADVSTPADIPIKNITLYRSGVGYFERRTLVDGDKQLQLKFATEQINDILKSMVILDLDGGRIDAVSYGSKEPLERRLASFGVNIADNPPIADILSRLRGAPVKLTGPDGPVSGTILGVEHRPQAAKDHDPVEVPFVNLVTDAGIKSVDITRVASFEILDKDLAAELGKALAALAEHHADRVKTVDLTLRGQGSRTLVVAYVHEMPVWKTSYRLVLPEPPDQTSESKKIAEGGQPTIQGWAIVENTTDEDWQDVRLSLVAGRPVSFQMDLYEPLHVERPEIPVPTVAGVMPRIYAEGAAGGAGGQSPFRDDQADKDRADGERLRAKSLPAPGSPAAKAGMQGRAGLEFDAAAGEQLGLTAEDLTRYAAQSQAQAGDVGEVFQYQLKQPVTVERQRSAMLPILFSPIDGRRVSIYNRADSPEHPMRGVQLTNTTGMQLMPGPISVFDGASYAGDAQIGHVPAADKRLLAYAVDLDVAAQTKENTTRALQKIRIVKGLLEQTSTLENRVAYAFTNKDQKRARTLLVEQPKNANWKLIEPKKPAEETDALYRFELDLPAGKDGSLAIVQQWVERQSYQVTEFDLPTLLAYSKQGKVSQAVIDAVKKAADMQAAVSASEQRLNQLEQERNTISQDQGRIRENMRSVNQDTDLYRRYMGKLNDQESRLEAISTSAQKERDNLNELRAALDAYVRSLDVE